MNVYADLGLVRLRDLEPRDYDSYLDLELDADVKQHMRGSDQLQRESLRQRLQLRTSDRSIIAVADSITDNYLGRCGLIELGSSSDVEIYVLLDKSVWGRSIAPRIVNHLVGVVRGEEKRPVGIVNPDNERSRSMLRKLGWVEIGVYGDPGWQYGHLVYSPAPPVGES